jgi:hypothetical protein
MLLLCYKFPEFFSFIQQNVSKVAEKFTTIQLIILQRRKSNLNV